VHLSTLKHAGKDQQERILMNLSTIANANESTPTATMVAVNSQDQRSTNDVKLFEVTVVAEVRLSLSGSVNVYASDPAKAVEKVCTQIDAKMLDDDLEMEDVETGYTMPYRQVKQIFDVNFQIDGVDRGEEDVDPADVLHADVKHLEAVISWDTKALAKRKAFLESLLEVNADDQMAVAA
jgi:hypothetical protein